MWPAFCFLFCGQRFVNWSSKMDHLLAFSTHQLILGHWPKMMIEINWTKKAEILWSVIYVSNRFHLSEDSRFCWHFDKDELDQDGQFGTQFEPGWSFHLAARKILPLHLHYLTLQLALHCCQRVPQNTPGKSILSQDGRSSSMMYCFLFFFNLICNNFQQQQFCIVLLQNYYINFQHICFCWASLSLRLDMLTNRLTFSFMVSMVR